ncbi:MAG: ABC transporter ATP-binding protein [Planctomycetota bacterium]
MDDGTAVRMEEVSFSYGGPLVLEDASFAVTRREFVAVVGPNGGGKTTILRLILGLLKPTKGSVTVLGTAPVHARGRVGYVPQSTSLDERFPVSVMDVVLMGRLGNGRRLGPYGRRDREIVGKALRDMKLYELRHEPFSRLSGGMRQRALISRALASEPELLLLDEPTSSLDIAVEHELYELLCTLSGRLTVILVSHDLGFVSQYVGRVVCVKKRVAAHPTSELTGEVIREIYGTDVRMVRHDRCDREGRTQEGRPEGG